MISATKTQLSPRATSHDDVVFPSSISPQLQDSLRRWAIPFGFNQEIARLLLDDLSAKQKDSVWYDFLHAVNRGRRLPISYTRAGQFVFSSYMRDRILRDWQASDESRAIYQRLNHLLYEYFEQRWQDLQAEQATEQALEVSPIAYLERSLYHHFASDAKSAFKRFKDLFEEYEWLDAVAVCDRLLVIAQAFEQSLSPVDRFWLAFYQAKFHDILAYSPDVAYQTRSRHRSEERQALESLLERVAASPAPQKLPKLVAMANVQLGNLAIAEDRLQDAIQRLEVAVAHFQQSGDLEEELAALNNLGLVLMRQGDPDKAVRHYETMQQRLLSQAPQDHYSLGVLLLNLGNAYAEMAARREAQFATDKEVEQLARQATQPLVQAFEAFEKIAFHYGQGLALATLGRWFLLRGEYDEAIALFIAAQKFLPEDAEEYETVKQWLALAQKGHQSLSNPAKDPHIVQGNDDQFLTMMYFVSYGFRRMESLFAFKEKYQSHPRKLTSFHAGATALESSEEAFNMGVAQFNHGQFRQAIGFFEESIKLARQEGHTEIEFKALAWLSAAWCHIPDTKKAAEMATRLLASAHQEKNQSHQLLAGLRLCEALAKNDVHHNWPEIHSLLLQGLQIARQSGHEAQVIEHLARLGEYAVARGEMDIGLAWLQEALSKTGAVMDTKARTFYRYLIYTALANLMSQHGNDVEAVRYAEIGLAEAQNNKNPFFIAEAELTLAQLEQQIARVNGNLTSVETIRAQAQRMGWRGTEQRAEYLLSGLLLAKGQADNATKAANHALELARELQMREAEVTSLLKLAEVMRAYNRKSDAQETLREVKRLSQQRGYEEHLNKAEDLLASLS